MTRFLAGAKRAAGFYLFSFRRCRPLDLFIFDVSEF